METNNIDWLGVLATKEDVRKRLDKDKNCFINNTGEIQFYIKIISHMPGSSVNSDLITCFRKYVDDTELGVDDKNLSDEERIENFVNGANECFFIFKYEVNASGYKVTKNTVRTVLRDEEYFPDKEYNTVPMIKKGVSVFRLDKNYKSYEEVLTALKNNDYISKLDGYNTTGLESIPYILYYDNDHDDFNMYVIGYFTGFEYNKNNGIKYKYDQLKSFKLNDNQYIDIVDSTYNHSLAYVGDYLNKEILKKLGEEEAIYENKKEDEYTINNENVEEENEEWEFIEHFEAVARNNGLFYTRKDLINFHTAVKSNPLVILSGLSGTGKSQLVQCYAKALNIVEESFYMIPVRPNWNDDSDLIGFVDSMHMVYRPSDAGFINVLIEASQEKNKDKLYIVCFDEMNLARVEHYFSQFLSILEMSERYRILRLYSSEYESRLYNSDKYKSTIEIGNNIRFIGTVNIDESTFHFSDKVLDRANVINLDIIPYTDWKINESDIKGINTKNWKYDDYQKLIRSTKDSMLSEREREFIWKVHELLNSCSKNLGVGPRILKQIAKYLSNLPIYNSDENISRREGVDIQFVQRIMTKIRGQKEQLEKIFDEKEENSLINLFDKYSDISDFDKSRKCLNEKKQELNDYGYTL